MNSAMVAWAKSALRHEEKLIREADTTPEKRAKAREELAKIAYYLLEAKA